MFAKLCAKRNKKGFTLAELLIVVAIVGILVAISVPVFTSALDKAKVATDDANYRAALAASSAAYMEAQYDGTTSAVSGKTYSTDGDFTGTTAYTAKTATAGKMGSGKKVGSTLVADATGGVAWTG